MSFLTFSKWADEANTFEITALSVLLCWLAIIMSSLCEPGEMVINAFEGISDEVIQCDWYALSPKLQRMYVIFLSDTQNPKKLLSYGGLACERATLKRVSTLLKY